MNNMFNSNYESSEFYTNRNSIYQLPPPPQRRRTQSQPSVISITVNESHKSSEILSQQKSKPFNVNDSNMLFNSQFLTKMLHPFSNEEIEKDDNKDSELEKALLNSDYDNDNV